MLLKRYKTVNGERVEASPFWQIEFTLHGIEVKRSSKTADYKKAGKEEKRLRNEIEEQLRLGVDGAQTWEKAKELYLRDKSGKATIKRDKQILDDADVTFAGMLLKDIPPHVHAHADVIAQSTSKANANAHLAILRCLLRRSSRVWKWKAIDTDVAVYDDVPKFEAHAATEDEIAKLLEELPRHQIRITRFALETGLRFKNITHLRTTRPPAGQEMRWPWVSPDFTEATIPGVSSKNRKIFKIPLSEGAQAAIKDAITARDEYFETHPLRERHDYIFADHKGRGPVRSIWNAWDKARDRVGMPTFRFHDLRHTWASWKADAGVPERILQLLGAWKTRAMVHHYTHTKVEELREWV